MGVQRRLNLIKVTLCRWAYGCRPRIKRRQVPKEFNLVVSICNLARINKFLQTYFEERLWENFLTNVLFDTSSYLGLVFFSGCDIGADRRWMMECSINSILREATAQYIKLRYILSPFHYRQATFFGLMVSGSPQHICKHTAV
jgi:hypothetical protein